MLKLRNLLPILAVILLASCSSQKTNLTYFDDIKNSQQGALTVNVVPVRLAPDDILTIAVTSIRPEATAIYNAGEQGTRYRVDARGDITFPVLGKIHVEGMTTDELAAYLTKRIEETVVDPFVSVQLSNMTIQVLGEVNRPGTVMVNKERFSILDAIAAVNDLTAYGQRDNVLILRKEGDEIKYYHINLNDSELLSSPLFYLHQNDVVIVEPNNIKKDNSKYNMNNAYKLQVISTIVSASSVVASLAIALAVK